MRGVSWNNEEKYEYVTRAPIEAQVFRFTPLVRNHLVVIGAFYKEISSPRLIIEKFSMAAFSSNDVQRYGIVEIMQRALRAIDPMNNKAIHLSLDLDGLDPLEAPSTGTPGQ